MLIYCLLTPAALGKEGEEGDHVTDFGNDSFVLFMCTESNQSDVYFLFLSFYTESYNQTEGKEERERDGGGGKEGTGGKVKGVGICTVNPTDGHRLEDGEKQQAGSTAGEMVVDLKHIQTPLHREKKDN